jgi:hypothetical protein
MKLIYFNRQISLCELKLSKIFEIVAYCIYILVQYIILIIAQANQRSGVVTCYTEGHHFI